MCHAEMIIGTSLHVVCGRIYRHSGKVSVSKVAKSLNSENNKFE